MPLHETCDINRCGAINKETKESVSYYLFMEQEMNAKELQNSLEKLKIS